MSTYSEPSGAEELARIVQDARQARGKRKTLRKPSAPSRAGQSDLWERMRYHLRKLARRALNDLAKLGHPVPPPDALADALAAYVWAECSHMVHEQAPGEPTPGRERVRALDGAEAVERVARNAAEYALGSWDADYLAEMRRRGAAGGSRSRRRPTWTPEGLDALAALGGLSVAVQADRLGTSVATIKRMRRALKDRTTPG